MRKPSKYTVKEGRDGYYYPKRRVYIWGLPTPFFKYFKWSSDYQPATHELCHGVNGKVACHLLKYAHEFVRKASNENL